MSAIETCRTAALGGHVERCEDCAHERVAYEFLPQPSLPEVSGRGGAAMARRARGSGTSTGSLLSRRLHAAGFDQRGRVPEQGRRLRSVRRSRPAAEDVDHHRRRPEASGRAPRPHRRAPHLGLGADPSSACPRRRSRRRPDRRTGRAGSPASPASSCRCACCRASFVACFSKASPPCTRLAASRSSGDLALLADQRTFDAVLTRARRTEWVVYAKRPFAGPQAVLAYLARYTHRVSPSQLAAHCDRPGGRDLQMEGLPDQRPRPAPGP